MSSSHSDDLQSLHGIASDSGYTSAASTTSRKRAPSLTSLDSSRSRSTSSNRRGSSLNAKFDRLNASMSDVAAASATSAGAGTSLGVQRKTIAHAGEGTRGSVQGSASMRRGELAEEETGGEIWRDDEAGERERRKRRRMNEAVSGPGSSLGAVGEAFRLLSWDLEGRRGSREGAEEGEPRPTGRSDQAVQLTQISSPSGSGRVRTTARHPGESLSQPDHYPASSMTLPPWMVNEKPPSPPRTFSPPPEWLARLMAPSAPRRTAPPPLPATQTHYNNSHPDQPPLVYGPHSYSSAPPLDSHSQPSPYSQHAALPPTPFSTSGRMESSFSQAESSYGPPPQQPLYEAQLARESSAMEAWREEATPGPTLGWNGPSDLSSFGSGGLGLEEHFELPRQQHFARPTSPPPPPPRPPPFYASQIQQQQASPFNADSYLPHRPSPISHSFDYPSTTALLRANGWQSPAQPFEYSHAGSTRGSEVHATSSDPSEETTHALGNFWKRAPRPARMDDVQTLHRPPSRDRYAESLLQSATAPTILAPRFPSPPQYRSPPLDQPALPTFDQEPLPHLLEQPTFTPRQQPPIADYPPPLSRKSSSSAARAPLLPVSQPRPQKQPPTTPLAPTFKPTPPFPAPPPPTRQRSFPRPDPVFRPSTAPNPPTSPLLNDETEEPLEQENKQQVAGATNRPKADTGTEAATSSHLLPPAPDASPLRAPSIEGATQDATATQLYGEKTEGEVEEEDDFESRSTDGDSIFPPSLGGTTMTTRMEEERELPPLEEEPEEEEERGEEQLGDETGGRLLAGANFSIFEDPEDPIQRFTQD